VPTRERRSDLQQETRGQGTKKSARKKRDVRADGAQENSLSKLVTRKEATSGRQRNKDEKGTEAGRKEKVAPERLKTASILNTHPVSTTAKRPYDASARTDSGRA
jgi:hypothetical protein